MSDKEYLNTTMGELLEMRAALNAALKAKLGREADSYFNIEMGSCYDDRISFCLAYADLNGGGAVVNSYEYKRTPQAAFDFAMERIDALNVPSKQDKIDELKRQIEGLENE